MQMINRLFTNGKVAVMRLYNIYYLCKMSIDGIKKFRL